MVRKNKIGIGIYMDNESKLMIIGMAVVIIAVAIAMIYFHHLSG